jgi:hypothetical protein
MIWASAPEGNFESNENRTPAAKPACAWNSSGTAKAVPFLRTSFHSPWSAKPVVNSTESRMKFANATNINRKSGGA